VRRGAYLFTADGRLLVQQAETGETRPATKADRTKVGAGAPGSSTVLAMVARRW